MEEFNAKETARACSEEPASSKLDPEFETCAEFET